MSRLSPWLRLINLHQLKQTDEDQTQEREEPITCSSRWYITLFSVVVYIQPHLYAIKPRPHWIKPHPHEINSTYIRSTPTHTRSNPTFMTSNSAHIRSNPTYMRSNPTRKRSNPAYMTFDWRIRERFLPAADSLDERAAADCLAPPGSQSAAGTGGGVAQMD